MTPLALLHAANPRRRSGSSYDSATARCRAASQMRAGPLGLLAAAGLRAAQVRGCEPQLARGRSGALRDRAAESRDPLGGLANVGSDVRGAMGFDGHGPDSTPDVPLRGAPAVRSARPTRTRPPRRVAAPRPAGCRGHPPRTRSCAGLRARRADAELRERLPPPREPQRHEDRVGEPHEDRPDLDPVDQVRVQRVAGRPPGVGDPDRGGDAPQEEG